MFAVSQRKLRLLACILVFAGIGSYIVFKSNAATEEGRIGLYFDTTVSSVRNGDKAVYTFSGTRPDMGQTTCYTDPGTGRYQCYNDYESDVYIVKIRNNPATMRFTNVFSCGTYGVCSAPVVDQDFITICVAWDDQWSNAHPEGARGKIFDLEIEDINRNMDDVSFDHYADTGGGNVDCDTNEAMTGSLFGTSQFARAPYPADEPSPTPAAPTTLGNGDGGNGGSGTGQIGSGTGPASSASAGGGSGGSSATTVSNEPKAVAVSSSQGDQNQSQKLTPSPFFDGKDYEKGNATQAGSIFPLPTKSIGWQFVLLIALFVCAVIWGLWLLKRSKHNA